MTDVFGRWKCRKAQHFRSAALASTVALFLCAGTGAASSEPALGVKRTEYAVLETFSQDFGSKLTTGYFVSETGKCVVTLRLTENPDPEWPWGRAAAEEIRLTLDPGEVRGLDSEDGQSLTLTCGKNASALVAGKGERDALIASQKRQATALPGWTGTLSASGKGQ